MTFSGGGWPVWKGEFSPFGQELDTQFNSDNYKFTGKERDTESGLDYFGARYYGSNMGRFMSPDPGNAGAVNADPQSWNAYAYVRNNPLNLTDPTGTIYCRPANDAEAKEGVGLVCDVTDQQYGYSSKAEQAAYDKAGYQHYDASSDTEADKEAYKTRNGEVFNDPAGDAAIFGAVYFGVEGLLRSLVSSPSSTERAPQDIKRQQNYPEPPSANNGNGTIGTNPNQRVALDRDIAQARQEGATDIRVNQEQINSQGVRVGQNRPDLQYTDRNGIRHYVEYDQDPSNGAAHAQRLRANDPTGVITTKTVK
jgi:RHS repeat-associated protein